MLNKKYIFVLLSIVLPVILLAQTDKWTLQWDANSESDMYLYRIYRDTHPAPTSKIDSVAHPAHSYEDLQVQKGVLYYYRIKAVDFSLNASDFSEEVSAAIPKISGFPQEKALPPDTTIYLQLNDYVYDPDHSDDQLSWTVQGQHELTVQINSSTHVAAIQTPSNWQSVETLTFTCSDPDTFEDAASLRVTATGYSAAAPQFDAIPEQSIDEDHTGEINLLDYCSDSDSPDENLEFSYKPAQHFTLQIQNSILTFRPANNWNGSETITVYVSDETALTDTTQIVLTVRPVNDAPTILPLPTSIMPQDSIVTVNMGNYAYDVDNTQQDLQWSFSKYYHVALEYDDNSKIVQITSPKDWYGFEYILATVSDPQGASATDTMLVQVTFQADPPQINGLNSFAFNEDDSLVINLNEYVNDPDTPNENLLWQTSGQQNLTIEINQVSKSAKIKAAPNWNGSETVRFTVTDPEGMKDEADVLFNVAAVNDAPSFKAVPNVDLSNEKTKTVHLADYVLDVDDPVSALNWSFSGNQNINISIAANGDATFTAPDSWNGLETITLYVSDARQAADTTSILAYSQDPAHAPNLTNLDSLVVQEDMQTHVNMNYHISDPDNTPQELTWEFFHDDNLILNFDTSTLELQIKPAADWFGTDNIIIKVTDPDNNFDFDTLHVKVLPLNDAPQLRPIDNIVMYGSTIYSINLKDYIVEPDGLSDISQIEVYGNNGGFIGYLLDESNYSLTFYSPAGYQGHETFVLMITDSEGLTATAVFTVYVFKNNFNAAITVQPFGSATDYIFKWTSTSESQDFLDYGSTINYTERVAADQNYSVNHEVLLENLLPNHTYHFRIASVNEEGYTRFSADSVFITGEVDEAINVFPIPFKASESLAEEGIYFTNLPEGGHIFIYNLLGETVYRSPAVERIFKWSLLNNYNRSVQSGLYLYVIKNKSDKKLTSGKIIIIR